MTSSPRRCPRTGRSRAARAGAWLCALVATAGLIGCVPLPPPPPVPVSRVDSMFLMLNPPNAMNWDAEPGADGLQLQVYFGQRGRDAPVLGRGTLEFLLFEGNVPREKVREAKPFKTWQFTGDQLKPFQSRMRLGWGYGLRLGWGLRAPTTQSITLFAQYLDGATPTAYGHFVIPMKPR